MQSVHQQRHTGARRTEHACRGRTIRPDHDRYANEACREPGNLEARSAMLLSAKAAGVQAIETLYVNFKDRDGLLKSCRAAAREGASRIAARRLRRGSMPAARCSTPGSGEVDLYPAFEQLLVTCAICRFVPRVLKSYGAGL